MKKKLFIHLKYISKMSRRDRELKSYALFKCLSLSGIFVFEFKLFENNPRSSGSIDPISSKSS